GEEIAEMALADLAVMLRQGLPGLGLAELRSRRHGGSLSARDPRLHQASQIGSLLARFLQFARACPCFFLHFARAAARWPVAQAELCARLRTAAVLQLGAGLAGCVGGGGRPPPPP